MLTAAGTATANNLPLLLFPGDTFASRRPDPVLQQIEQIHDLNITTNDALNLFRNSEIELIVLNKLLIR